MNSILITGATSGLGRELATQLAKRRRPLIITGRDKAALEKLEEALSHLCPTQSLCCDMTNPDHLHALCALIRKEKPSLVINSAGLGLYGDIFIHSVKEQIDALQVNVVALTEITLTTAQALKEAGKKGVIMNISSAAGFLIYPGFSLYSASKAYVTHMSRSLDAELKGHGIRVFVSCPGQIKTSFRYRASKGIDKERKDTKTMTTEKAAHLIIQQIDKGISYQIIDLRYKVLVFLARYFIPKRFLQRTLQQEIMNRIRQR